MTSHALAPNRAARPAAGLVKLIEEGIPNRLAYLDAQNFDLYPYAAGGVPEPATWAMMIMGFGLVGFAARRRAAAVVTTA